MAVLQKLFDLYALNIMEREGLEFVTSGATTLQQIELIEEVRTVLYEAIRPHAVKLFRCMEISGLAARQQPRAI